MRAVLVVSALVGCGFQGTSSTGAPVPGDGTITTIDAAIDAPDVPGIDAAIDAPMIDAAIDAPPVHSCGTGYVAVAGSGTLSTYRKYNTNTTWQTARATCQQATAYLVIPETTAEAIAVYDFVSPANNSPFYWAGIEDADNNNVWMTVLGTPFVNPPWAQGQPSNGTGENYVLVGSSGSFYDYLGNAVQEYACECAPL